MSNFLPRTPGRERRLAYGNYIRNINRNRINRINNNINNEINSNFDNSNFDNSNFDNSNFNTIVNGIAIRNNRINNGILLYELIMKSDIYFKKDIFLCSICLNEKNDNIIRRLICNHNFHINCIDKWLSCNITCPICRLKLI